MDGSGRRLVTCRGWSVGGDFSAGRAPTHEAPPGRENVIERQRTRRIPQVPLFVIGRVPPFLNMATCCGVRMAALRKAVGRRLRQARDKAHMTQEALAHKLHVETTTLSRYERGEIGVSWEMLERVADALRIPIQSLVGDGSISKGLRADEDELVRSYRTLTATQKRVARWMMPRLRELK